MESMNQCLIVVVTVSVFSNLNHVTLSATTNANLTNGEKEVQRAAQEISGQAQLNLAPGSLCRTCNLAAAVAKRALVSEPVTRFTLFQVCTHLMRIPGHICRGLIQRYSKTIYFVVKNTNITHKDWCAIALHPGCAEEDFSTDIEWTLPLPPMSESVKRDEVAETSPVDLGLKGKRILHLTDLHYDPHYLPGSVVNCLDPLCCRKESQGSNKSEHIKAGHWGSYWSCDAPKHTIEALIDHIRVTHGQRFDYVYWTGDNSPHDTWQISKDEVLGTTKTITGLLMKCLPKEKRIFVALGNHEGVPTDQFSTVDNETFQTRSVLNEFSQQWSLWLESEEALSTFKYGGYYSKTLTTKLKVISLNTNVCNRLNVWNLYHSIDPFGQLNWLIKELYKAETSGQFVHLIGHIPPDTQCVASWLRNYIRIITRFKSIIKGQFYGHQHLDLFKIYYDSSNGTTSTPGADASISAGMTEGEPVGVAYIGPSLTQYNPSYRFYLLNSDGSVADTETYFSNLTEANRVGQRRPPIWRKGYSAKAAYNLSDLSPNSWNRLYQQMKSNLSLVQKFYEYSHRFSDEMPKYCDDQCRERIINGIGQTDWFQAFKDE